MRRGLNERRLREKCEVLANGLEGFDRKFGPWNDERERVLARREYFFGFMKPMLEESDTFFSILIQ